MPVEEIIRIPSRRTYENSRQNGQLQARAHELGVPGLEHVVFDDDFMGDVLRDEWQGISAGTSAATIAISADAANGIALLQPGTDSGGYSGASIGRHFTAQRNATLWVYFAPFALTNVKMEFGFTDAHNDTGGAVNSTAGNTFTATDFVGWVFDTNDDAYLKGMGVAAGVAATQYEPEVAPSTAGQYLGIMTREDGAARFVRLDASGLKTHDSDWRAGFVTETVNLTPWVYIINRAVSVNYIALDRLLAYQRRNAS